MRKVTLISLFGALVFVLCAIPDTAAAGREGLIAGLSVGPGSQISLDCSTCESKAGASVGAMVGGMINKRLALMFDLHSVGYQEEGVFVSNAVGVFAAQYWFNKRFWAKAGVGGARVRLQFGIVEFSKEGVGWTVGAGYEVYHGNNDFAIDVRAQFSGAHYSFDDDLGGEGFSLGNAGVMAGFNWY